MFITSTMLHVYYTSVVSSLAYPWFDLQLSSTFRFFSFPHVVIKYPTQGKFTAHEGIVFIG